MSGEALTTLAICYCFSTCYSRIIHYLSLRDATNYMFCGANVSVWAAFPHSNRFLLVAIYEGNAHWLSQCCHWVT